MAPGIPPAFFPQPKRLPPQIISRLRFESEPREQARVT
jgi:hypothetical protein